MVCIYCLASTRVVNSRLQKQNNHIWRRRKCLKCGSLFTTNERPDLGSTFTVEKAPGRVEPFSRDKLFVSILESCRHRTRAISDATGLTQVVINQVLGQQKNGLIKIEDVTRLAHQAVERFDPTAGTVYAAYHPRVFED